MRKNTTEVIVGAVVLAVAGTFLFYMMQVSGISARTAGYDLTANFRSVEGVSVGTDVRLAGVSIGVVTGVVLNTDTYRAETIMTIDNEIAIPDDSAAVVASVGLLGGTFLEIVPGGSLGFFEDGALVEDTQGAISVVQLLTKFVAGGDE